MATINRSAEQIAEQNLIDGLKKHEATLMSLVLAGTTYKTADVITEVQDRINSAQSVISLRAAWRASIASDQDLRDKQKALMSALRAAIRAAFGGSIDVLADFGLAPRKTPVVRTPQQKIESAEKAKATRAARHTMGKNQKAAIKGTTAPVADAMPAPAPVTPHS